MKITSTPCSQIRTNRGTKNGGMAYIDSPYQAARLARIAEANSMKESEPVPAVEAVQAIESNEETLKRKQKALFAFLN